MSENVSHRFVDFAVMPQLVLCLRPDIVGVIVQRRRSFCSFLRVLRSCVEIALIELPLGHGENCCGSNGFRFLRLFRVSRLRF